MGDFKVVLNGVHMNNSIQHSNVGWHKCADFVQESVTKFCTSNMIVDFMKSYLATANSYTGSNNVYKVMMLYWHLGSMTYVVPQRTFLSEGKKLVELALIKTDMLSSRHGDHTPSNVK